MDKVGFRRALTNYSVRLGFSKQNLPPAPKALLHMKLHKKYSVTNWQVMMELLSLWIVCHEQEDCRSDWGVTHKSMDENSLHLFDLHTDSCSIISLKSHNSVPLHFQPLHSCDSWHIIYVLLSLCKGQRPSSCQVWGRSVGPSANFHSCYLTHTFWSILWYWISQISSPTARNPASKTYKM